MAFVRSPDYRVMNFGDEITVRSNAASPPVDFFRRVFDTMREKPYEPEAR